MEGLDTKHGYTTSPDESKERGRGFSCNETYFRKPGTREGTRILRIHLRAHIFIFPKGEKDIKSWESNVQF